MAGEKHCCGHCLCLWLSGLFAMPAIAHIVRSILGWPMTIAEHSFTIRESIVIAVVAGILSAVFGIMGCVIAKKTESGACC